jgi:hypothetical protein
MDQAHQAHDEPRMGQDRELQRHREHVRIRDRQAAVVPEPADFAIAGEMSALRADRRDPALEARHDLAIRDEGAAPAEHGAREVAECRGQALEAVLDDGRSHGLPRPLDQGTVRSIVMLAGRAEAKS